MVMIARWLQVELNEYRCRNQNDLGKVVWKPNVAVRVTEVGHRTDDVELKLQNVLLTVEELVCDRGADLFKFCIGAGPQRADRGQTDNDDQSQHNGVLDCGRSIFFLQKANDAICEFLHVSLLEGEVCVDGDTRRIWLRSC